MPTDTHRDTRERLLLAALKAFGKRDFDAVSTREIVAAAGVNISAISYHFGGKQGLYLATAEFLTAGMVSGMAASMATIRAQAEHCPVADCAGLLDGFVRALVNNLLQGELANAAAGFILREQNRPTAAFDILFERLMHPLQQTFALLAARLLECPADSRHIKLLTHALMGQIIAFRGARTTILRQLGQDAFTSAEVDEIANLISQLTLGAIATQAPGECRQ